MPEITSLTDSRRSRNILADSAKCRITKIFDYWAEVANDAYGFGVVHGLSLALDAFREADIETRS